MNRASCGFARRLFAASPVVMFARVFTHACFYAIVFASSLPQCIFYRCRSFTELAELVYP